MAYITHTPHTLIYSPAHDCRAVATQATIYVLNIFVFIIVHLYMTQNERMRDTHTHTHCEKFEKTYIKYLFSVFFFFFFQIIFC